MKTIEDYVWFYYDQGFSVIPLGKRQDGDKKRPSLDEWKKYQKKRASKKELQTWLDTGMFVAVGIICGKVSRNLAVIDYDELEGITYAGSSVQEMLDKNYWVAKTGKGYHIYTISNPPAPTKNSGEAKVDLKSEGGYVVAPPSLHKNGNTYAFINDTFKTLTEINTLAAFKEIVKRIKKYKGGKTKVSNKTTMQDAKEGKAPCITAILNAGVEDGRRNNTLYCLASYYKYIKQLDDDDVLKLCQIWNASLPQPMETNELMTSVDSVTSGDKKAGCTSISELGFCQYSENPHECPFMSKYNNYDKLAELSLFQAVNVKGKPYYPRFAEFLISKGDFNFKIVRDESTDLKDIYVYDREDGYYKRNGEDVIRKFTTDYVGDITTETIKSEVVNALKDKVENIDRAEMEADVRYINLGNGIYDIKTRKLLPHTPDKTFLQKSDVEYKPGSKCPKIMKFFKEVLKEDEIPIIQEMFGYSLYRSYDVSVIFMLLGTGRNGKGVTLKLLKELVGARNISSRKLHELSDDQFAKADLYGRLINICGETTSTVIKNTAQLKELTGDDWLTARRLYHGGFQFQNYAKLVFSTNQLPKTTDYSLGLLDRMRIVHYTKIFNSTNPITDTALFKNTLNTSDEIQGLLMWSLEGLHRLLKNDAITGGETLRNMGQKYDEAVNYVWNWMDDNLKCVDNHEEWLTVEEIYKQFEDWTIKTDKPRIGYIAFCKTIFGWGRTRGAIKTRKIVNGVKETIYRRMTFSGTMIDDEDDTQFDEPDGKMRDIGDACPAKKKDLVERFGKTDIDHLLEQGILIKLPNGKLEVDV